MANSDLRDTFFQECDDLLEEMGDGLRRLSPDAFSSDTVNSVFRAVHSIKGGAGAFKLTALVEYAHGFETLLDELRAERLALTDDILRIMHNAGDHLADMVAGERDELGQDDATTARLAGEIAAVLPEDDGADDAVAAAFVPMALNLGPLVADAGPAEPAGERDVLIRFQATDDLYQSGNEPALLFRELGEIGALSVEADTDGLPDFDAMEIGKAYIAWRLRLTTGKDEAEIRQVFEFVESTCELTFETDEATLPPPLPPLPPAPPAPPEPAPPAATDPVPAAAQDVAAVVAGRAAEKPAPAGPIDPAGPGADSAGRQAPAARGPRPTIRVDLERIDRLINVVGELIIHQAMLTQAVEEAELSSGSDISTALDELKQLSRDIQESVMAIRAQPVKPLFDRMFRIVREAGEAAGKQVQLITEGEAAEVDKTVVEKLADPLTHMVRNAIDHGLESPEKRVAAGKPARGKVTLSAGHRSGRVLISVADDGGGINRDKVLEIAISKGLVAPDAELTEAEIDNLLFLPGFSTATEVSSLSGRGVGMDVVKNAIQTLGGRVAIQSSPGKGTTFSISLPLTLAVLDGMVVGLDNQQMVVPITTIVETLRPQREDLKALGPDSFVLAVRGSYLPVIDVGRTLGFRPPLEDISGSVALLIETEDGFRAAFIVDSILDQRQVVIKSLQENYGVVPGVAAATVFGDGRVALIIDPSDLLVESARATAATAPASMPMEMEASHGNHV